MEGIDYILEPELQVPELEGEDEAGDYDQEPVIMDIATYMEEAGDNL